MYGVLLYKYDNFDKINMVVGISDDHMPAALTLKIAKLEDKKTRAEISFSKDSSLLESPGGLVSVD